MAPTSSRNFSIRFRRPILAVALLTLSFSVQAHTLTFEERVDCQEAIERVYYSYQIGTTKPFEEAVPRETMEAKVSGWVWLMGSYWSFLLRVYPCGRVSWW